MDFVSFCLKPVKAGSNKRWNEQEVEMLSTHFEFHSAFDFVFKRKAHSKASFSLSFMLHPIHI